MHASQAPTLRRGSTAARDAGRGREENLLVLGRYRLHRRLGTGGFGTVWEARDERLDRDVAVKILPRERIVGGRFEREARAAARLAHPAIVTLYEAGADDEGAYLVSELVRGATFDALGAAGRLSDRDILAVGVAICDALAHAHAAGIVHRDVKPSNILVPDRPVTPAHPAKLTDFGVARVVGGDSLTRTGDVVGTAAYMAPEQAAGRDVTASADLYGLALVIYEALTGLNPVRAGTAAQGARRLGAHLPPLRRQRRELPRDLGRAVDLALRPKPRERGTIEELREALAAALPDVGDTPGIVAQPWRSRRSIESPARAPESAGAPDPPADTREHLVEVQRTSWPERALGAVTGAALATWAATHVLTPSPVAPATVALIAGGLLLALPRIGWGALVIATAAVAAGRHDGGAALAVVVAGLIPILALPRAGVAWPLPAIAAALGAVGLATAWPSLAARAHNPLRRALLGAGGWVFVALTAAGVRIAQRPPFGVWSDSPYEAWHHVLVPIATTGVLLPAAVWALAAVSLPHLVRLRRLPIDVVRVVIWTAVLVSATSMAPEATLRPVAALGGVIGAIIALAPSVAAGWRGRSQSFSHVP
jgi:hypothetical protein